MNKPANPWANIAPAEKADDIKKRRTRRDSAHDFFWAVDHLGRPGIQFSVPNIPNFRAQIPALSEIQILLTQTRDGDGRVACDLDLFLRDDSMREIFLAVCVDLMDTAEKSGTDGESALNAVVARIGKWQQMLKKQQVGLMSEESQTGLWGELSVLRDLFLPNLAAAVAAEAWSGPTGGEQDFSLDGLTLAEVKTQRATSDRAVIINSADQLDNGSGVLFLVHQTIAPSENGVTLQGLVSAVRDEVQNDATAYGRIVRNLQACSFADNEAYDKVAFAVSDRKFYRVEGDFPRIIRGQLPAGVSEIRYGINIAACAPFLVEESVVVQRIKEPAD